MKLLSINGNCQACEMSMHFELNKFKEKYEIEEVYVNDELIKKYNLIKTPALVLLDGDNVVGILYGYQPEFILEEWLKAKERSN